MSEDEAKAELKQLLTIHMGFSLTGLCCVAYVLLNQI